MRRQPEEGGFLLLIVRAGRPQRSDFDELQVLDEARAGFEFAVEVDREERDRQVALVFLAITLLSLVIVIISENYLLEWNHTYTVIFSAYFLTIFGFFFYVTRIKRTE